MATRELSYSQAIQEAMAIDPGNVEISAVILKRALPNRFVRRFVDLNG